MPKTIIAANWKMNLTIEESIALAKKLKKSLPDARSEVILCASFTALPSLAKELAGTNLKLGSQNIGTAEKGAFTGEISPAMLEELGIKYSIIGHSERRHVFHEDNQLVNKRLKAALKASIIPIFCIGEKLEEREGGETEDVLEAQLKVGLTDVSKEDMKKVIIAYEPVWAIGSGRNATPDQAEESHQFVRSVLKRMFDEPTAESATILYGGSVTSASIKGLMQCKEINGALVGASSLDAEEFEKIVKF